jgi:DNA-binding transcriptional regulator YbjK
MTTSTSATTTDWHRRQRALVAASLIAVPGVKSPTHRRWA